MLIYRNKNVISQQLDDFLIDNPIDCYCINDRSGLKVKDDDSVDVILSKDAPEDTTNWLPVGDGGFHLYMRIYTPDMEPWRSGQYRPLQKLIHQRRIKYFTPKKI